MNRETLTKINPDIVIVKPCGYKLDQTIKELNLLKKQLPWQDWEKKSETRFYLVDGNSYFNRPGPRILDSLEILAYCIQPNLFPEFEKHYAEGIISLSPSLELL